MKKIIVIVLLNLIIFNLFASNNRNQDLLFKAIKKGNLNKVIKLIEKEPLLINATNKVGETPLLYSLSLGELKIAEYLIKNNADLNVVAKNGLTALKIAEIRKYTSIIDLIINKDPRSKFLNILIKAIENGDMDKIRELSKDEDFDYTVKSDVTPLLAAYSYENLEIFELLISLGADVNLRDENGTTLLAIIAINGGVEYAKLIVNNGGNVYRKTPDGKLPIIHAFIAGRISVAEVIAEKMAEMEQDDEKKYLVFVNSIGYGFHKAVELYIKNGIDVNHVNIEDGTTPVIISVITFQIDMTRALIEAGADLNIVDKQGNTVLDYALKMGNSVVIDLLKQNGAKEAKDL